jgi:riboflavin synthase
VDGVSLTVNAVRGPRFELNIIPQTLQETTIRGYGPGTRVNVEVDLIARYVERLLLSPAPTGGEGLTRELLARHGFVPGDGG